MSGHKSTDKYFLIYPRIFKVKKKTQNVNNHYLSSWDEGVMGDFLHYTYFLHCKTTNMYRYFIRENNYRKG